MSIVATRSNTLLDPYLPTSGRQPTGLSILARGRSNPADMILGNLLLLVLSLYSASVFASDYDGTRIANRTIERVRLLFSIFNVKPVLNSL